MILRFNDVLTDKDGVTWFFENRWNSLFCKRRNAPVEFVGVFPKEEIVKATEFRNMVSCCGFIIFTPFDACNIHMIDPKTKHMECIELDIENIKRFNSACLYGTFVYKELVYFLQACDTQLIVLNVDLKTYKKIDIVDRKSTDKYLRYWSHRVIAIGETFYLCDEKEAIVFEFDPVRECVIKSYNYKNYVEEICDFAVDDDGGILFADRKGNIFRDIHNEVKIINRVSDEVAFVKYENSIYLFSFKAGKVVCSVVEDNENVDRINETLGKTRDAIIEGEYLFTQNSDGVYFKDLIAYEKYEIDESGIILPKCSCLLKEGKEQDLYFFLNSVVNLFPTL